VCAAIELTHLCFADDLLVFSAAKVSSVSSIIEVHAEFELLSGLKANSSKSSIFLAGVDHNVKQEILKLLHMPEGNFLLDTLEYL
jgi:hypothetical protein